MKVACLFIAWAGLLGSALYFANMAGNREMGLSAAEGQLAVQAQTLKHDETVIAGLQERVQNLLDDLTACKNDREDCDE